MKLVVVGNVNVSQNLTVNNSVLFVDGTSGSVGIGTTNPEDKLHVEGKLRTSSVIKVAENAGLDKPYSTFGPSVNQNAPNINDFNDVYVANSMEVDGTLYLTGGYQMIIGDLAEVLLTEKALDDMLCAGNDDCREERKINADSYEKELEAGDLVCTNVERGKTIMKCAEANSKSVVGFVSNTTSIYIGNDPRFGYPVAVAGLVKAKTTNKNGNINPTDLLVSSDKDGYAMKGNDPKPGTIVGKAFDFCYEEECSILVFVALS